MYKINKSVDKQVMFLGLKGTFLKMLLLVLILAFFLYAIVDSMLSSPFIALIGFIVVVISCWSITGYVYTKYGINGLRYIKALGKIKKAMYAQGFNAKKLKK